METIKTEILEYNVNWQSIKRACMRTIGKDAGSGEPPKEWKRKLLICKHSPIRKGWITWKWPEIPYAISTHVVRHHQGIEKYVQTERADRTGIDRKKRSQMDSVSMENDANIDALGTISGRRLCFQADPITRAYWMDLKQTIEKYDEDIAWSMVPQCVRCGGCVEPFGQCQFYKQLMEGHTLEEQIDVQTRYDIYDAYVKKLKRD